MRVEEAEESIRKVSSRVERIERNMRAPHTSGGASAPNDSRPEVCNTQGCSCGKPGSNYGACIDGKARKAVQESVGIAQGNKESMGKVAKELIALKTRTGVLENDSHSSKEKLQKIADNAERHQITSTSLVKEKSYGVREGNGRHV